MSLSWMSSWGCRLAAGALLLAGAGCVPLPDGPGYAPGYYEPGPRPVQYWGDNRWEGRRYRDDRDRRRWEADRNTRQRDRRVEERRRPQQAPQQHRPSGGGGGRPQGGGGTLGDRIIQMTR